VSFFTPIEKWVVPSSAITDSLLEMALDGALGNEGVSLWLGKRLKGVAEITHLVALRGPGVVKRPDLLRIESHLFNDVADVAIELGVSLLGQIHSHGGPWVDLSWVDSTYGVAVPYYLSVVAPYFGMNNDIDVNDCGVHVFEPGRGYRRLPPQEVTNRIHISYGKKLPFLTVGEKTA
jgi:hypothetical protein